MSNDTRWYEKLKQNLMGALKSGDLVNKVYEELEDEIAKVRSLSKGYVMTLRVYSNYREYLNEELYTLGEEFVQKYNVHSTGTLDSLNPEGKLTMYVGDQSKVCMVTSKQIPNIVCAIYVPKEGTNKSRFIK